MGGGVHAPNHFPSPEFWRYCAWSRETQGLGSWPHYMRYYRCSRIRRLLVCDAHCHGRCIALHRDRYLVRGIPRDGAQVVSSLLPAPTPSCGSQSPLVAGFAVSADKRFGEQLFLKYQCIHPIAIITGQSLNHFVALPLAEPNVF